MVDLLIEGGTVITQNERRDVIEDGTVAIEDGSIVDVGASRDLHGKYSSDERIDATNHIVMPGLIDAHVHVSDILLRGLTGEDRRLFDWLYNVKVPGLAAMTNDNYRLAATLFCHEAIRSGITTFVENDMACGRHNPEIVKTKLEVYDDAGVRNIFGYGVKDQPASSGFRSFVETVQSKEPNVNHPPLDSSKNSIEEAIRDIETLLEANQSERQMIWIAPAAVQAVSTDCLRRAREFAEEREIMTTTHVAEADGRLESGHSQIEYLYNIGYLGDHTLLNHCVHVNDRDIYFLAETDTRVTHNLLTNLRLGSGIAPLPSFINKGVTVCMGTDNTICNDTVNPIADLRFVPLLHKGYHEDPAQISAQQALDMVTITAAHAIRKADRLGSIEPGKRADIALLDLDRSSMRPCPDVVSAVIYQAQGPEVDTVLCDGEIILRGGEVPGLPDLDSEFLQNVRVSAQDVATRAGLLEPDLERP